MKGVVTEQRRRAAKKHLARTHTCVCGRVCRGNGGWASHKHACPQWLQALGDRTVPVESMADDIRRQELDRAKATGSAS